MGPEVVNKNKNCVFNGPYAGRDLYITMLEDTERKFVVTHKVNIKPTSYFTGRETELLELSQRIEDGRKSVLVSGMGGIGKTQICRKLFDEYNTRNGKGENVPFQHMGFIEYDGDMDSSLQNCLQYKKQDNPDQNKEAAWRELEYLAADGKLLLFVDNVDKSINSDQGLQRLKSIQGAIVLTSRQASFGDEFEPFPIGFLGRERCIEIYEKIRFRGSGRKVSSEEVPDLKYVIESLAGRHTITVEFLAHLAHTKLWTVKRLREELEQKGFRLEFHKEGELINIQKSYEVLYDLSQLTEAEQNILEAFSVFPYIPLAAETCNDWLLEDAGVSEDDDILIGLYQKGWLQFDIGQESYALHLVFAQFIYEKCKPSIKKHTGLMEACQKCLKISDDGSALECQKFIPFAENIIKIFDVCIYPKIVSFKYSLAQLLEYIAEYSRAEKIFEELLEVVLDEEDLLTAVICNSLAGVYYIQGKYSKAKELNEKSLRIHESILGENHPDTAASYNNLARLYSNHNEYEKAKELYKKSLSIYENIYGENHLDTAIIYNNLAAEYKKQGEYAKAEELYKKSLKIREYILGENHPDISNSYNNLAIIYRILGEYSKAEELYKKSLKICKWTLGENHPNMANGYNNLAVVYDSQGKYEEAKELYKRGLQIRKYVYGENHPDTASSYDNLAIIYEKQGKYIKAEELYKESLRIRIYIYGENHSDTALSYTNLAVMYELQGKYEKAKELYEKSLSVYEGIYGENHLDTALSYNNLAGIYNIQGKYSKAKELYEKSLRIRESILGENHPDVATSYHNLAVVCKNQGEYKKAKYLNEKSLKIRINVLGENHPDTAASYNNLAIIYGSHEEYDKAKELFEKSLVIRQRVLVENHPDIASSYNNLAVVYSAREDYKLALVYLLKAYKIYIIIFGLSHPTTKMIYINLKTLYDICCLKGDFEQWLEEKMKE